MGRREWRMFPTGAYLHAGMCSGAVFPTTHTIPLLPHVPASLLNSLLVAFYCALLPASFYPSHMDFWYSDLQD